MDDRRAMSLQAAFIEALEASSLRSTSSRDVQAVMVASADWLRFLPQAYELLDAAESARVACKRRSDDRDTTTLAYACHRLLLARMLDCEPAQVPLTRDAQGCPRLPDTGLWTSLSHAEGWVAFAVSPVGPVGIDIEPASRVAGMAEIAARVCHPRELALLSSLPPARHDRELLALWVRKEALLKAAGIGLAQEMDTFTAPAGEPLALPGANAGSVHVHMLDAGAECMAAIACLVDARVVGARVWPAA